MKMICRQRKLLLCLLATLLLLLCTAAYLSYENNQEPQRTTKNHQKLKRITKNNQKQLKTTNNNQKPPRTTKNHKKTLQTTNNNQELTRTTENHQEPPYPPAQPAPNPHALANYKPTNWSRVHALPWTLDLPPVNTSTCLWPKLDPWHPDILQYVTDRPGDRVNCTNHQKTLLYTSMDRLVLNTTALQELDLKRKDVRCTFVYINGTDGVEGEGPVVELEGEVMVLNPRNLSLLATCKHSQTGRQIYKNLLFYVPPRTEQLTLTTTTQYSVSILLIDSTSQMNLIRSLPKTHTLLEQLGGLVFMGHHKVAANTYPNVLALMTGNFTKRNYTDATANEEVVASKYRRRGWTTMYLNDDYYTRDAMTRQHFTLDYEASYQWLHRTEREYRSNYGIAWQDQQLVSHLFPNSGAREDPDYVYNLIMEMYPPSYRCLQEQLLHKQQFKVIEEFNMYHRARPSFHFVHLNEYSHDDHNMTPLYDTDLAAMLTKLTNNAALDNTFFFLIGDHGFHYGPFASTKQGRVEDNMPMLAIIPPPNFGATHPNMLEAMRQNTKELTSHWDVHRTLEHILAMSVDEEHEVRRPGTSLLTPVGARTCPKADVPAEYCSCIYDGGSGWHDLKPEDVTELVVAVLADIDDALALLGLCQTLALEEVKEASSRTVGKETIIEASVVVVPRRAQFTVKVVFPVASYNLKAAAVTVTRTDPYRFTSLCVRERRGLQSICICRDTTWSG